MTLLEYLDREVKALAIRIRESETVDGPALRSAQMLLQISKACPEYPEAIRTALSQAIGAYSHSKAVVRLLRIIPLSYGGEKDKPV